MLTLTDSAFPKLSTEELEILRLLSISKEYADGEVVFKAGEKPANLHVVESGHP